MNTVQREQAISDAKKISEIFSQLSEESKTIILAYMSALRDKELADLKTNNNVSS